MITAQDMSFDDLLMYIASEQCVYKRVKVSSEAIQHCKNQIAHYQNWQKYVITYRHMPDQWFRDQLWAEGELQAWEHKLAALEYKRWWNEQLYKQFWGK